MSHLRQPLSRPFLFRHRLPGSPLTGACCVRGESTSWCPARSKLLRQGKVNPSIDRKNGQGPHPLYYCYFFFFRSPSPTILFLLI